MTHRPTTWTPAVRRRSLRAALLPVLLTACYVQTPVTTVPGPGTELSVNLTDRGRVELGSQIGPEVRRLEGSVVLQNDSAFTLRVTRIEAIDGSATHWTGESVRIPTPFVRDMEERRFSRPRTALAIGTAILAATAFILTRDVFGFGDGESGRQPPPGPPSEQ